MHVRLDYPPGTETSTATPGDENTDLDLADAFHLTSIAGPFEHPLSIGFLPDGALLVTERPGRLQSFSPAGSRPSKRAANTLCAAARAWCSVTAP
ncbi:MAG TPA: PQQ-dependent sugar dehydrogenase [Xanthobacteraceae bacterium]|nr:PQQ-dependent sugar dehydrogenase [Xanthobacteraceae bacterium]